MTSVFVKSPNDISINESKNTFNYSFLDKTYPDYKVYYQLLQNTNEYKIKNIYHFIYTRLIQMDRKFGDIDLLPKQIKLNYNQFNTLVSDYISEDKIKAIYVINSICHYFYPEKY